MNAVVHRQRKGQRREFTYRGRRESGFRRRGVVQRNPGAARLLRPGVGQRLRFGVSAARAVQPHQRPPGNRLAHARLRRRRLVGRRLQGELRRRVIVAQPQHGILPPRAEAPGVIVAAVSVHIHIIPAGVDAAARRPVGRRPRQLHAAPGGGAARNPADRAVVIAGRDAVRQRSRVGTHQPVAPVGLASVRGPPVGVAGRNRSVVVMPRQRARVGTAGRHINDGVGGQDAAALVVSHQAARFAGAGHRTRRVAVAYRPGAVPRQRAHIVLPRHSRGVQPDALQPPAAAQPPEQAHIVRSAAGDEQVGDGMPVADELGGVGIGGVPNGQPARPAVPVCRIARFGNGVVIVFVKVQAGPQLVPRAGRRAAHFSLRPHKGRPISRRPRRRRRPVPIQVIANGVQTRQVVNVNQIVVIPVVIPLRRPPRARVFQRRILIRHPEIPRIIAPGGIVHIDVPVGVNARVAHGLLQPRRSYARRTRRAGAGRPPRGRRVPVRIAHRAAPGVPPHQPARAVRPAPGHRPQRVGRRQRPPVVVTHQPAGVPRGPAGRRCAGVHCPHRSRVAPHQPAHAVVGVPRHRAGRPGRRHHAIILARNAAHIARRHPAARHAGIPQRQPVDIPAAAHHPEQPQALPVSPADVQVVNHIPVAREIGGVGIRAAAADGLPALAAVPVGIAAVHAAAAVRVKVQIRTQLVPRAGGRTTHPRVRRAERRPVSRGPGVRRRPVPVRVITHRVQPRQVVQINQVVIVPVIIPLRRFVQPAKLQNRVVMPRTELPRIIVPRHPVHIHIPGAVNTRIAGGGLQAGGSLARAAARAAALPGSLRIPVGIGNLPARAMCHQAADAAGGNPARRIAGGDVARTIGRADQPANDG